MSDNPDQLQAELVKLEQTMVNLRDLLSDEALAAALTPLLARQAELQASLSGSGAMAQGKKARAVGERGVMAKKIKGDVITGDHVRQVKTGTYIEKQEIVQPDPVAQRLNQLETRYLRRLVQSCNVLPLAALGGEEESTSEVTLADVYIALNTKTRLPLTEKEKARLKSPERTDDRPVTTLEAAVQTRRLVILGHPGSGKSTFVRHLAVRLALAYLGEQQPLPGWPAQIWPMLTNLRDLAPRLAQLDLKDLSTSEQERRLSEAVRAQWQAELGTAELADVLEDRLINGQALLIFDGLDEVPETTRQRVRQAVRAILDIYSSIRQIIVTCRSRSYIGAATLPGFTVYSLAPFGAEQIKHFISAWYEAQVKLGRLERARATEASQDLQQAAQSKEMKELATSPMLLTTMAIVHQREVGLPKERVKLYALAVQVLLSRWQKRKGPAMSDRLSAVLSDDLKIRVILERLAYEAHHQQAARGREADLSRKDALILLEEPAYLGDIGLAAEFLDYVDQRAGLLVGRGGDEMGQKPQIYNFLHRTFQEYLAGCQMVTGRGISRAYWRCAAEGDYWYLAGQLGAEELYHNRRNIEGLLDLAYALCPEAVPANETDWRAALWSGQMAVILGRETIEGDEESREGGPAYLKRLSQRLIRLLSQSSLRVIERVEAGQVLARLGDPRSGVGLRPDGLPDLVWCEVPAGSFLMGSDKSKDGQALDRELPQHTVNLPTYRISRYPITNAQYAAFIREDGYTETWRHCWTEAGWKWKRDKMGPLTLGGIFDLPNHPVVAVSWHEAIAFCRWLTERLQGQGELEPNEEMTLPSERQWEKAARGMDGRIFPWGDEADSNRANYRDTEIGSPSAVGCFPGGTSPYDCEEMSGNVLEWCKTKWQDSYEDYRDDNDLEKDAVRVLRGGAYDGNRDNVRCAFRLRYDPVEWYSSIGFRVVVSPIL